MPNHSLRRFVEMPSPSIRRSAAPSISGFTLIELLIVVAIIAVLAAIAVPNFLQAQTRSKVARVKSDQRTLSVALESYLVDVNRYPPVLGTFSPTMETRLLPLTTPVAYLTSIPRDPFLRKAGATYGLYSAEDPSGSFYLYQTGQIELGPGGNNLSLKTFGWSLTSGGPDLAIEFPYFPFARNFVTARSHLAFIYDPTNGATSRGEIFRRGGRFDMVIPEIDSPK